MFRAYFLVSYCQAGKNRAIWRHEKAILYPCHLLPVYNSSILCTNQA